MATTKEIDSMANILATETGIQRNNMPPSMMAPNKMNEMTVHMMKGMSKGFLAALDPPWQTAIASNQYNADRASFGPLWFNRGVGWCLAGSRRISALGLVQLRGVVYTNSTNIRILTLPPNLRPAQNEYFSITAGTFAGNVYVWTDGAVGLDVWPERTTVVPPVLWLSLSGIQFEAAI